MRSGPMDCKIAQREGQGLQLWPVLVSLLTFKQLSDSVHLHLDTFPPISQRKVLNAQRHPLIATWLVVTLVLPLLLSQDQENSAGRSKWRGSSPEVKSSWRRRQILLLTHPVTVADEKEIMRCSTV